MRIEVIAFELTCQEHGRHTVIVPAEFPRPRHCAHCFREVAAREELRRFTMEAPVPSPVPSEAFIG